MAKASLALPLLALGGGAALLAAVASGKKKEEAQPATYQLPGVTPGAVPGVTTIPGTPTTTVTPEGGFDVQAYVLQAVASGSTDYMRAAAHFLDANGYPQQAQDLREMADALDAEAVAKQTAQAKVEEISYKTPGITMAPMPTVVPPTTTAATPIAVPTTVSMPTIPTVSIPTVTPTTTPVAEVVPVGPSGKTPPTGRGPIHVIKTGDTLSGLSQTYTGSANNWRELRDFNSPPYTTHSQWGLVLHPGDAIRLPDSWVDRGWVQARVAGAAIGAAAIGAPAIGMAAIGAAGLNAATAADLARYLRGTRKYKEDRGRVRTFQTLEGLKPDGRYDARTALSIARYGIVPPVPFYWHKTNPQNDRQRFRAGMVAAANKDPARRHVWMQAAQAV